MKVGCYKEIHRVLKPGQCFAAFEWCMTDSFDPNNEEHLNIKVVTATKVVNCWIYRQIALCVLLVLHKLEFGL